MNDKEEIAKQINKNEKTFKQKTKEFFNLKNKDSWNTYILPIILMVTSVIAIFVISGYIKPEKIQTESEHFVAKVVEVSEGKPHGFNVNNIPMPTDENVNKKEELQKKHDELEDEINKLQESLKTINEGNKAEEPQNKQEDIKVNNDPNVQPIIPGQDLYDQNNVNEQLAPSHIIFKAKILYGKRKGEIIESTQETIGPNAVKIKHVKVGDRVLIAKEKITVAPGEHQILKEDSQYFFITFDRTYALIALMLIFVVSIIFIGKFKGFTTLGSLVLIGLAIVKVYLPAVLVGVNIYLATVLLMIYVICICMTILNGFNLKTLAAILGNLGGILIAGLLGYLFNSIFKITGILDEETVYLFMYKNGQIEMVSLIWATVAIGALGAIMDTAMSIASSIREISINTRTTNFGILFDSGMEVGKDAISTMISTLILAYIGGALSTTLLMTAYAKPGLFLINSEYMLVEILKAVIGAIGILFTVPLTGIIASLFEVRYNSKKYMEHEQNTVRKTVERN